MGREIRRVPAGWEHPRDGSGNYIPLLDFCYDSMLREWEEEKAAYDPAWHGGMPFEEYYGGKPYPSDYMPTFPEGTDTHYQLYENVSEGTPLTPVFATPEEVARYAADNGVFSGGHHTATYEQWLRVCKGGYAPSFVISGGRLVSGVEAFGSTPKG